MKKSYSFALNWTFWAYS